EWISIVNTTLTKINPYMHSLRVFKDNLYNGILELLENTSTEEVAAIIHANIIHMIDVIEFQKHRFLHAHIVMCVQPKLPVKQIDKIISAELPREQLHLKNIVKKFIIHKQQHSSCCLYNNNTCIYGYPKPLISETYVNDKGYIQYHHWAQEDA
ncbi:12766_t:CDS:2, partial [Cetraspora pellucida]